MDPREQDTREKLDALEKAMQSGDTADKLFALASSSLVAIDFRTSDAMIGIPEVAPDLVHELRTATYQALVKAAERGHVKAALTLGERIWLQRDDRFAAHAVRALERIADADASGRAHHLLGMFHFHGLGVLENKAASVVFHQKAAELGDAESMFELYAMLSQGIGTEPDLRRAVEWCRRAADAGNARAMYNMGAFHATGRDVPQDDGLATHWYGRAADAGHGRAAATLGVMLAVGKSADLERARQYVARADKLGFDWRPMAYTLGLDDALVRQAPAPEAARAPKPAKRRAPAKRAKKKAPAKPARKTIAAKPMKKKAPAKTTTKKAKPKARAKATSKKARPKARGKKKR